MNENTVNQENLKPINSKPPYLLGLLGFIPLVGLFVGIALILYGTLKYKDRKLSIIGIACVCFTILVYSTLFYVGFVSDFGKKAWEPHAQMQLNGLIKDIEYYKIQNGKYPDNLQQLENDKDFIFMTDPTQSKFGTHYYNYKNLGDKYELFSSGSDGIPKSEDDIFPEVQNAKNIGWTKNP